MFAPPRQPSARVQFATRSQARGGPPPSLPRQRLELASAPAAFEEADDDSASDDNAFIAIVRCDILKAPLLDNFDARGWYLSQLRGSSDADDDVMGSPAASAGAGALQGRPCGQAPPPTCKPDTDWVLWWASVQTVRGMQVSSAGAGLRLLAHQKINHFPNHWELTRKDRMYGHILRYSKAQARASGGSVRHRGEQQRPVATGPSLRDFVPVTFALPNEFAMFADAAKANPQAAWIVKPANRSQGRGIFLISRAAQVPQSMRDRASTTARAEPHIISRYVERPLLVAGRKFDLRIYILVVSFRPLRAFRHEAAFARFCRTPYPARSADGGREWLNDLSGHLTNTSLQKRPVATGDGVAAAGQSASLMEQTTVGDDGSVHPRYSHDAIVQQAWGSHGGKWPWENVLLFVASRYGDAARRQLVQDLDFAIVESLRAVQGAIVNDPHSFELYGYDVLIDEALRPWLVEVNASPSLEPSTAADLAVKSAVISDTLDIVAPTDCPETPLTTLRATPLDELETNGFTCIVDDG